MLNTWNWLCQSWSFPGCLACYLEVFFLEARCDYMVATRRHSALAQKHLFYSYSKGSRFQFLSLRAVSNLSSLLCWLQLQLVGEEGSCQLHDAHTHPCFAVQNGPKITCCSSWYRLNSVPINHWFQLYFFHEFIRRPSTSGIQTF